VRIVVDASVAVKWVLDEPGSEAAVALRDQELIAPALWLAEAANALWRHARIGEISNDQAVALFSELREAPLASLPIEPHIKPALKLAMEIGHPVYDCLYLALALHHQTHVVTADRRFFASAASTPGLAGGVRFLTT
jgi:predicted nucleic acid-binding protein